MQASCEFCLDASRLHDSLLHLVAELRDASGPAVVLERERDIDETLAQLRSSLSAKASSWEPAQTFVDNHRARLADDLTRLWPPLDELARHSARELTRRLDDRGAREAEQLREILQAQLEKIGRTLAKADDGDLSGDAARQRRLDREHLEKRRVQLEQELASEPEQLRRHYAVTSQRVEAVGIVYLIPQTR